ncbi:MAG: Hpt domain-containing protein [Pseudobdellovibrionaceae bacterium]
MKNNYSFFDTLLDPVFVLNEHKQVIYCNEPAATLASTSLRKILSKNPIFTELLLFTENVDILENLSLITEASSYKEIQFKSTADQLGTVQLTVQPSLYSNTEWLIYLRDVTLEERLQKKYRSQLEQKEVVIKDLEEAKLKLENYSKNLENMVQQRTTEISRINTTLQTLLDSLNQGFFIFDTDGEVLPVYSKACIDTLEALPINKMVWDVFKLSENEQAALKKWMTATFAEALPFEDMALLTFNRYKHSQGKHIDLQYHPYKNAAGALTGVVVVATDITSLVEAKEQAANEKAHVEQILYLLKRKKEIALFVNDAKNFIANTQQELLQSDPDKNELFRYLHTLKGGSATFALKDMADLCHQAEDFLENKDIGDSNKILDLKKQMQAIESTLLNFIDQSKKMFGDQIFSLEKKVELPLYKIIKWTQTLNSLEDLKNFKTSLKNEYILDKIETLFYDFEYIVQDLSVQLNKPMQPLKFINGALPVWGEAYSSLISCLVHAFRNTMDHGIEDTDTRRQLGKSEQGQIQIHFQKQDSILAITIEDDGQGLSVEKIKNKLLEKSIDCSNWSDFQIMQSIFLPQFSTRSEVSELSGRGVGADAIMNAVQQLQGKVWVESQAHKGTRLCIQVPYFAEPLEAPSTLAKVA